jgi:hypothetical protein
MKRIFAMSKEVPGKSSIAYLCNRSDLFVTDFTPKLYSNDMTANCQAVNLSSADNSSQFSGGQTMLLGVPISMDVELMELQETDQITDNGESENTTTGSRSNTQQPDEASSSLVIQNILINTEHDKDTDTNSVDTRQEKSTDKLPSC